jgi:hypothetical protein
MLNLQAASDVVLAVGANVQTYQQGDQVEIILNDDSALATVLLVSAKGCNLVLKVDGFFYGTPLPVVWTDG